MSSTDLCSHAHAARNVHTEHHQRVLQILVVVFTPVRQVEVVSTDAWTLTDPRVDHAIINRVFGPAELAKPHLKQMDVSDVPLLSYGYNLDSIRTHASLYRTQTGQRCSTFHANDWLLEKLLVRFWKQDQHMNRKRKVDDFNKNGVLTSTKVHQLFKIKGHHVEVGFKSLLHFHPVNWKQDGKV